MTEPSLREMVEKLVLAAKHLLQDHDCDAHGYERVCAARDSAQRWLDSGAEVDTTQTWTWPLRDCVTALASATEHLIKQHACPAHPMFAVALEAAKAYLGTEISTEELEALLRRPEVWLPERTSEQFVEEGMRLVREVAGPDGRADPAKVEDKIRQLRGEQPPMIPTAADERAMLDSLERATGEKWTIVERSWEPKE